MPEDGDHTTFTFGRRPWSESRWDTVLDPVASLLSVVGAAWFSDFNDSIFHQTKTNVGNNGGIASSVLRNESHLWQSAP